MGLFAALTLLTLTHQHGCAVGAAPAHASAPPSDCRAFCLARHPALQAFAASPTCALIRIRIKSYVVVRRFQEVTEWRLGEA